MEGSRRVFIQGLAAGVPAWMASPGCAAAAGRKRPNIVFIMSDDSGYSDPGFCGGEIETPNLDRLARGGMKWTQFYNAARCSPTRAAVMTGRWPQEVGMGDLAGFKFDAGVSCYRGIVDQSVPMIPEILGPAGYHTMMAGKWHLGGQKIKAQGAGWQAYYPGRELTPEIREFYFNGMPKQRGFDRFFGLLGGEWHYFVNPPPNKQYYEGNELAVIDEPHWYSTRGCTDKAIEYLREARRQDDRPFFLYLPYQAPHHPLEAPKAVVEKYRALYFNTDPHQLEERRVERMKRMGILPEDADYTPRLAGPRNGFPSEEKRTEWLEQVCVHAAMQEVMDGEIGRVVETLREMGELEHTLICYCSDNGAAGKMGHLGNTPFQGSKALLWEGGSRSPLIAHWPGVIPAGTTNHTAASVLDLMPTFLDAAGVSYPASFRGNRLDTPPGRSLMPAFRGGSVDAPEYLHWDLYGQKAVVYRGRWKLLINPGWWVHIKDNEEPVLELYDLDRDPAETRNLASSRPELVEQLRRAQRAWEDRYEVTPYGEAIEKGLGRKAEWK
ncbi:sulfatase-like hydrolase/transferase [Kiritimatiella glycovorans]|uniref:Arylsulfatase n=1 Tax=Kiritimatiella glycovorans TaxID=1307763 RepID=A0A0G3ECL3_9BACT|nr:sulfatase-like hydrolase/transferase [Kiritimatiella glycovorans]AKJ64038.1 Arylsulfatase [Kiritimatiella glycovorans]